MDYNDHDLAQSLIKKYERERKHIQREQQQVKVVRGHHAVDDDEEKRESLARL